MYIIQLYKSEHVSKLFIDDIICQVIHVVCAFSVQSHYTFQLFSLVNILLLSNAKDSVYTCLLGYDAATGFANNYFIISNKQKKSVNLWHMQSLIHKIKHSFLKP